MAESQPGSDVRKASASAESDAMAAVSHDSRATDVGVEHEVGHVAEVETDDER